MRDNKKSLLVLFYLAKLDFTQGSAESAASARVKQLILMSSLSLHGGARGRLNSLAASDFALRSRRLYYKAAL